MKGIDYGKISITAKLVAYLRQYSDIPFAQDVASFVNAEEALREISSKLQIEDMPISKQKEMEDESKALAPLLEARYKSIVHFIQEAGARQVLELASGFSLRGLAMSQDSDLSYVESDLSDINEEKHKLVSDLRTKYKLNDSGNHHIATANALDRADLEAATAKLNQDQPLVIVNEGLIPYLTREEQATLAKNVRFLLNKFDGGAWITPDFTTRNVADGVSEYRKRFREAISSTTERQLHEAAFASEQDLDDFLDGHGFTGVCSYQTDVITTLVSQERLGLSNVVVERLKSHMRIWLMSPV